MTLLPAARSLSCWSLSSDAAWTRLSTAWSCALVPWKWAPSRFP
ncbi:Uncharacterised protein [Mycobacteroides abscessus subsp. abscessus]|nr:Uncharacterised protein [Mycobacteroides abscessus subsp. abscessus]